MAALWHRAQRAPARCPTACIHGQRGSTGDNVPPLFYPPLSPSPAVYTSPVGKETCVTVALLAVWPIIVEATKSLNPKAGSDKPVFPW